MPYTKQEFRSWLNGNIIGIINTLNNKLNHDNFNGDLAYIITKIIVEYLKDKEYSFILLNGIVGVLDNTKDEFKRRILIPYEISKIIENGDVYK